MNGGGAGPANSASCGLDPVGVLVGVPVVAMPGTVPEIGKSRSSDSFVLDGLDVGEAERSTSSCGAAARPVLGCAVQYPTGTVVGPAVGSGLEPSLVAVIGPPVGVAVTRIEDGATVGIGEPSSSATPRSDGASVGSNDVASPGVSFSGMLVGDFVGYGPWTIAVGPGVTLLAVSPALDGAAVGADENIASWDPMIGLRVGNTPTRGEVGKGVRLGALSSPSVLRRDGVGVGSRDTVTADVPPVGVLVGDVVEARPGIAVGLGVSV